MRSLSLTSLWSRLKAEPKDLAVSLLKPRTAAKLVTPGLGQCPMGRLQLGREGHSHQVGPALTARVLKFSPLKPRGILLA